MLNFLFCPQKLPTRFGPQRSDKEIEATEVDYNDYMKEENRSQLKGSRNNYRRGRGGREQVRVKKPQRKVTSTKTAASRRNAKVSMDVPPGFRQPGRTLKQAGVRGPRTVRKRRTENKMVEETLQARMANIPSSPESGEESPRNLEEEWDDDNVNVDPIRDDDNIMGEEEEEEEAAESDDNAQEEDYEQGNWEVGFNGVSNKWNGALMEASDEDVDAYEDDENGIDEEAQDVDSEGDMDGSEESDGMPNRVENVDEGSDSSASDDDYSD